MPLLGSYGIPSQPKPTTNWAQGYMPNDPMNMFGTKANVSTAAPTMTGGMVPQPKVSMQVQRDPLVGYTTTPAPQSMTVYHDNPMETGMSYEPASSYGVNPMTGKPMTQPATDWTQQAMGWTQSPTTPAAGGTGGAQSPAFQTQYATWDNIQPYMNPYLDQIINRGTNAIEHSAASRGLFGSTGNLNDIGTWATNAQSKAYGDAVGMFNDDRNYMTDNYWKNRIADSSDFWNTYNANWNQYTYGNSDYLSRLLGSYNQNQGIVDTGINATNNVGGIYSLLGNALAQLYGAKGDIGMQGAVNNGNNNGGLIEGLLGALTGGLI